MANKRIKKTLDNVINKEIDRTIKTEENIDNTIKEEIDKTIQSKPVSKRNSYTVYRNEGSKLFLIDSKGNGFKVPTPEHYKDAKKGDIIYI